MQTPCALLLALALGALPAQAAPCHPPHPCKPKAAKPLVDQGSAETPAQRERRLRRECKGRPNAGACEGYTR